MINFGYFAPYYPITNHPCFQLQLYIDSAAIVLCFSCNGILLLASPTALLLAFCHPFHVYIEALVPYQIDRVLILDGQARQKIWTGRLFYWYGSCRPYRNTNLKHLANAFVAFRRSSDSYYCTLSQVCLGSLWRQLDHSLNEYGIFPWCMYFFSDIEWFLNALIV